MEKDKESKRILSPIDINATIDAELQPRLYSFNPAFYAKENQPGCTMTSASYMCGIATQMKTGADNFFETLSFVNEYINLIGSDEANRQQTYVGEAATIKVASYLKDIYESNAFIAWYSEARKDFVQAKETLEKLDFYEWMQFYHPGALEVPKRPVKLDRKAWAEANNIPYPEEPKIPTYISEWTLQMVINALPEPDRCKYLWNQAIASSIGKEVQEDKDKFENGHLQKAREKAHSALVSPRKSSGSGRDTTIKSFELACPIEEIDKMYGKEEVKQRDAQKLVNRIKNELRERLLEINKEIKRRNELMKNAYDVEYDKYEAALAKLTEKHRAYNQDLDDKYDVAKAKYNAQNEAYQRDFSIWREEELAKLSKMKFVTPNQLQEISDRINRFGK